MQSKSRARIGILVPQSTHKPMHIRKKLIASAIQAVRTGSVTVGVALALTSTLVPANAANILWVSDTTPLGFSGPGGDNLTDAAFIRLLESAGHTVSRWNSPDSQNTLISQAELDTVNSYDLIIMGRAGASGQHQAPQGAQWNTAITKPLICMSPYFVRPDGGRFGWFTGGTLPDTTPAPLAAGDAGDPAVDFLFGGVSMTGSTMAGNFDELIDRNTSLIQNDPVPGAVVYARANFAAEANGAATTAYAIVGFPAGTSVAAGRDILAGYRMFFAGGSREGATFPNAIPLYTGRENLTPAGEDIFLRSVQLAANNGVAPAVDPQAPLTFTQQPASVTATDGATVTFRAAVSGPGPRTLTWERGDGVTFAPIPEGSTPFSRAELTIPVSLADSGAQFRLAASGPNGTVVSDAATLTVDADSAAPVPLAAVSLDGLAVTIYFNEVVEPNASQLAFSYVFAAESGSSPISATLRPDGKTVDLVVDLPLSPTFTVTISEVADLLGNTIPSEGVTVNGANFGLTAASVGALNPGGGEAGIDAGKFQVSGGGLDFQATAEQMRLVYKSVEGDFDARIRVHSILATNRLESVAKAILTARATVNGDSQAVNAFVTPAFPGDSTFGSTARVTAGGPTVSNHVAVAYSQYSTPASFPNAWLRIKREGDNFTCYNSSNGTDWNQLSSISVPMGSPVLVGAGVNSHRNGVFATATFSDFQFAANVNPPTLVNSAYAAGSFSASLQTQNGIAYRIQYKENLNAANWTDLTTVSGDGSVKSFSDSATGHRFYRVITP
jgi:hypothetical protein